jgi:hypothetical protein
MSEKITSFFEEAKLNSSEILPIEHKSILETLKEISEEVAKDFITFTTVYVESILKVRDIVLSRGSKHLCQHLLDGLDNGEIQKVTNTARYLASQNPEEKIREIIHETLGYTPATPESLVRAHELVTRLKQLDIDFDVEATELAKTIRQLTQLSYSLKAIHYGYADVTQDRLSMVPEEDLKQMDYLGSLLVSNSKNRK